MSKIDDLIQKLCPDGVEYKTLGDVAEIVRGNGMPKADLTDNGVGAIHYGQIYTHYGTWTNSTISFVNREKASRLMKVNPGDLIVTNTSENIEDVCKAVAWLGSTQIVTGGHATVIKHHMNPKYLAYWFQSPSLFEQKKKLATGTKVIDVSAKQLSKIRVPVPPLAVQEEIVRVLDSFTSLEAELEAELEARKRQYEHYRNGLFKAAENDVQWSTLGKISTKASSGGTPTSGRSEYYGGGIPWLRTQEVNFNSVTSTSLKITDEGLANSSATWIPKHSVIVAMYGATAAKVAINEIPLTTNQACCNLQIDPDQAEYRYVFYWIVSQYEKLKSLGEGSQSNLNAGKVKKFPIPIPDMEKQQRIVSILDRFDALVSDLSSGLPAEIAARRKQYEYYRDRLLTFKELTV
jgi:type I restriction enzyme S subunit